MRVMHPSHRPGDTGANNGQGKADGTVPNLIDPPGALELLRSTDAIHPAPRLAATPAATYMALP